MAFGFDPALAAYLRSMNVEEQNIFAEVRQRNELAQRQYDRTLPQWAEKSRAEGQAVADDAETRGVYSAGTTVRDVVRAKNNVAMDQSEALARVGDEKANIGFDAARRLAELRRQRSEAELTARSNQATAGAAAAYGGP